MGLMDDGKASITVGASCSASISQAMRIKNGSGRIIVELITTNEKKKPSPANRYTAAHRGCGSVQGPV